MKITKSQLRMIIKEEVGKLMERDLFGDLEAARAQSRSGRGGRFGRKGIKDTSSAMDRGGRGGGVRDKANRAFADMGQTKKELHRARAAGDADYPSNEAEARAAYKKINQAQTFDQLALSRRHGFLGVDRGVAKFKKKGSKGSKKEAIRFRVKQ